LQPRRPVLLRVLALAERLHLDELCLVILRRNPRMATSLEVEVDIAGVPPTPKHLRKRVLAEPVQHLGQALRDEVVLIAKSELEA
jgi:hypothetical protein